MNARNVYRSIGRITDTMARAMMPRTSAADPLPEPQPRLPRATWSLGRRYETKGAFKLGEAVARA